MATRIANADLQALVEIQQLDHELKELHERVTKIPEELAGLEQEVEQSRTLVENAIHEQEEGGKERRRLETEVDALRQKLSKYKDQLMKVGTNKEYQAMLHEISTVEKEISDKQDEI